MHEDRRGASVVQEQIIKQIISILSSPEPCCRVVFMQLIIAVMWMCQTALLRVSNFSCRNSFSKDCFYSVFSGSVPFPHPNTVGPAVGLGYILQEAEI